MRSFRYYPRCLNIEGIGWLIKFKRRIVHNGIDCDGLCDSEAKTIYIRIKSDHKDMFRVLIHEVLHAIEFENEVDIPHKHIDQLDHGLARFLKNNWKLLKKIIE